MQPGGAVQTEGTVLGGNAAEQGGHLCIWKMCLAKPDSQARTPLSAWLYSSAAWASGWGRSCSFPLLWLRSLPLSHRRTCRESHRSVSTEPPACGWWQTSAEWSFDLLEASVKVSRRTRHDGFDEERLLAVALLVATHNTEAPAVIVGLLQHDVPAPMHVTETTNTFYT